MAVTDSGNLFAALEFSEVAKAAGVQPIIGCQLDLAYAKPARLGDRPPPPRPIVLLAQTETGYENLLKLNSVNFLDARDQLPHVTMEAISRYSEGLICLTGGSEGPIGALIAGDQLQAAGALLSELQRIYPDRLYIEIQRHPGEDGLLDA